MSPEKRIHRLAIDFKKIPDGEKIKELKGLLKAYQSEIDVITRRSKTAETAFLNLYKLLAEAPDPASLFETVSAQTAQLTELHSLQLANQQLRDELSQTKEQLAGMKKEEGGMATLKARLTRYEAMLDDMVNEKVTQKEAEMKVAMDEKIRIYKETEYSLQRQLSQLKDQMTSLQTTHEVTQARLVDHSQKYDEEVAAKLGELEIVMVDLDRANLKVAQLERDNDILKADLSKYRGDDANGVEWQDPTVLSKKIQSLEADLSNHISESEKLQATIKTKEADYVKRLSEMERDLARKTLEVAEYETKMVMYEDYDEIKRELDIVKSIEFDGLELDDNTDPLSTPTSPDLHSATPIDTTSSHSNSLERLLLSKNKKLQSMLTAAKLALTNTQTELSDVSRRLEDSQSEAENSKALVRKLEEDLAKVERFGGSARSSVGVVHGDGLSALVSGATLSPVVVSRSAEGSESSIVPILTSQRDRYRQRNAELEEQLRSHMATISDLRNEVDRLKADNVKLYERMRYAQTFSTPDDDNGGSSNRRSRTSNHTSIDMAAYPPGSTGDVANKYRAAYETSLDPFAQFHTQEKARRVRDLNPADRAAFVFTRMVLSHRGMRWGFVIYCVGLHLLVWWVAFGGVITGDVKYGEGLETKDQAALHI
ncbi:hypothetical protein SpCBS45565_g00954 [Spizellomyces sp. 'palustris']|nr:hypothetical protein SpCBS45565_g00954 [Spizellomyces sp. 'palustris']